VVATGIDPAALQEMPNMCQAKNRPCPVTRRSFGCEIGDKVTRQKVGDRLPGADRLSLAADCRFGFGFWATTSKVLCRNMCCWISG